MHLKPDPYITIFSGSLCNCSVLEHSIFKTKFKLIILQFYYCVSVFSSVNTNVSSVSSTIYEEKNTGWFVTVSKGLT